MQRQSYADLANDLSGAISWLEAFGIRAGISRIGKLLRILRDLDATSKQRKEDPLTTSPYADPDRRAEAFVAIAEAGEICAAHDVLRNSSDPELPKKLRRLAKGPFLPDDEGHGDSGQARDVVFELTTLALLTKASVVTRMAEPDLIAELDGWEFLIACKRPQSTASVEKNFTAARDQIAKQLPMDRPPDRRIGLVALSVTKIFTAGGKLFRARDEASYRELGNLVGRFLSDREMLWIKRGDRRIGGIVVHVVTPAVNEALGIPAQLSYVATMPLHPVGSAQYQVFLKLAKRVGSIADEDETP